MLYDITYTDPTTRQPQTIVIESSDATSAIAQAKSSGIIVTSITPRPELSTPIPTLPQLEDSTLAYVFRILAILAFSFAIIAAIATLQLNLIPSLRILATGSLLALILLAFSKILAYLHELLQLQRHLLKTLPSTPK